MNQRYNQLKIFKVQIPDKLNLYEKNNQVEFRSIKYLFLLLSYQLMDLSFHLVSQSQFIIFWLWISHNQYLFQKEYPKIWKESHNCLHYANDGNYGRLILHWKEAVKIEPNSIRSRNDRHRFLQVWMLKIPIL